VMLALLITGTTLNIFSMIGIVFLMGLVTNSALAAGLTFVGDKLGVDLSIAAIVAFGVRIFNNLASIRRHYI